MLFTDGVDTSSRRATYESTVRQAEESDALIYPVSYAALGAGLRGITPPTFPTPGPARRRPYKLNNKPL